MYLEKFDLSNRVAVITGGGRNIGLACAHALAEAGATIVIAEIDPEVAASGKNDLAKLGSMLKCCYSTSPDRRK